MIRAIREWLASYFGSSREFAHMSGTALDEAMARRAQAYARVRDAEQREDDRDLGRARMVLAQATHDELWAGLDR